MKMSVVRPLLLLAVLTTSLGAEARKWTNTQGRVITAEYISSENGMVKLRFRGKVIQYAIGKLSEADQQWISEQQKSPGTTKALPSALTGRRENVPIDARYFNNTSEYFKGKPRRNWIRAHEAGEFNSTGDKKSWLKRDPQTDRCVIYCPSSYDGTEPYGVFLYISSGNAVMRSDWHSVLDKHKLIAVSADAVGNYVKGGGKKVNPHPYRVSLSLDAMAVVERDYKIDPTRRYVCGTSGGGHMAFTVAALYPRLFKGAISSAAQSYLTNHFPGFSIRDFKSGDRKKIRWVVVSGSKDVNYNAILETSKVWKKNRLNYRFIDIPGMGHDIPAADALEKALNWIDSGK